MRAHTHTAEQHKSAEVNAPASLYCGSQPPCICTGVFCKRNADRVKIMPTGVEQCFILKLTQHHTYVTFIINQDYTERPDWEATAHRLGRTVGVAAGQNVESNADN